MVSAKSLLHCQSTLFLFRWLFSSHKNITFCNWMKESKSHQKRMFWLKIQEGVYPLDSITLRGLAASALVPAPTLHTQSLQCTQPESEFKDGVYPLQISTTSLASFCYEEPIYCKPNEKSAVCGLGRMDHTRRNCRSWLKLAH